MGFTTNNVRHQRRVYKLDGTLDDNQFDPSVTFVSGSAVYATDQLTFSLGDSNLTNGLQVGHKFGFYIEQMNPPSEELDSFYQWNVFRRNSVTQNYWFDKSVGGLQSWTQFGYNADPDENGDYQTDQRLFTNNVNFGGGRDFAPSFLEQGADNFPFGNYRIKLYHGTPTSEPPTLYTQSLPFQLRGIELTNFGMTAPAVDLNIPDPVVDIKGAVTVYPNQRHNGLPGWQPAANTISYRIRIGHPDLDDSDWIEIDGSTGTYAPDQDGIVANFVEEEVHLGSLVAAFNSLSRPLPDILLVEGRALMDTEGGRNTMTPLAVACIVDDDRELRKEGCPPKGTCNRYGFVAQENAAEAVAGAIESTISIIGNNTDNDPQSMGYGWQISAYKRCEEDDDGNITFHGGAGQIERWIKDGINYVAAHPDNYIELTRDPGQNIILTFLDKSVMRFEQTTPSTANQRLREFEDADTNKLFYRYESLSPDARLKTVSDQYGRSTTFEYTGESRQPSTVTTHGGRVTNMTYHPGGQLASMTDPEGYTTSYSYENGYLSSVTDPVGVAIDYTYSQNSLFPGRVESETYYGQMRRTYTFDESGKTFTVTETDLSLESPSASRTTISEFDDYRNVVKTTDPLGNETFYAYNDRYNPYLVTSVTNPNGTTKYSYNSKGFVTSVTDVNGLTTSISYGRSDLPHLVTSVTRPADGGTTKMTYSSSGNLTAIEDALGNSTLMSYDNKGYLESVQDRNGHITEYEYGGSHKNLTVVKAPSENSGTRTITMTYDNHDNVESVAVGSQTVSMEYDGLDRLRESLDALGNLTVFDFDNITGLLDAVDFTPGPGMTGPAKKTEMLYDGSGRMQEVLRQVENGFQSRAKYRYDGFSQLRELTRKKHSGVDKGFKITYDQLGRPKTSTDTEDRQSRTDYAPFCSQRSSTSARGVRTVSNFNNICQLIGVQVGTPGDTDLTLGEVREARSFLYDDLGRLKSSTQPPKNFTQNQNLYGSAKYGEGTYSSSSSDMDGPTRFYHYDALDRLTSVIFEDGKTALFEYFPEGQLKQVTDPEQKITKYTYHPSNALESVTVNRNGVDVGTFNYNYDSVGMLETIEYPAETGIIAEFSSELGARGWDANGRLIHLRYVRKIVDGPDTPLRSFEFSYDAAGNRTGQVDRSPSGEVHWTYEYDYLDRLSKVSKGTSANNLQEVSLYAYDQSDNRTVLELPQDLVKYIYTYDDADAIGTRAASHYDTNVPIFSEAFTSDEDGNLLTRTRSDTNITIRYGWDDFNKLISVSSVDSSNNPTNHVKQENSYNANGFRRKKKAKSGAVTTEYSTGLETAVARGAGDPISYIQGHRIMGYEQGGRFYWFLSDALGSVRDIVRGTDGAVLQSYDYKENGEKTTADPGGPQSAKTWIGGLSVNDDVDDSGLYLMGHRHYDPSLGRFVSQDPIGFAGGLNLYSYGNSPVAVVDPAGLYGFADFVEDGTFLVGKSLEWVGYGMTTWGIGMEVIGTNTMGGGLAVASTGAGAPAGGGMIAGGAATAASGWALAGTGAGMTAAGLYIQSAVNGGSGDGYLSGEPLKPCPEDYGVSKAVNSGMNHAAGRSVQRKVFGNIDEAREGLQQLSKWITQNKKFPEGSLLETTKSLERVLAPVGDRGMAVYQIAKNRTAKLMTVLNSRYGPGF